MTTALDKSLKPVIELTLKEEHLIREIRQFPFGEMVVKVEDSQPVRIIKPLKSIKL